MKAVILAGGLGSRLSEETTLRPKPMVEIGDRPMLWHIMKIYAAHGITDFVVCLGYKGYMVKEYFANYMLRHATVTYDLGTGEAVYHEHSAEPWRVTLVETGADTMTGGRIRRVRNYLDGDEPFLLTYGDGVGNVDITASIAFHKAQGRDCTMTVVSPPGRFGATMLEDDRVAAFVEKPLGDGARINAGFFICEPRVIDRIEGDATIWEQQPLRSLASDGQLSAFRHDGFWQPMDTLREKNELEAMWQSGKAPWKIW